MQLDAAASPACARQRSGRVAELTTVCDALQAEEALKALEKFDADEQRNLTSMDTKDTTEVEPLKLISQIVKKRLSVRGFIDGLHFANLHLQSTQVGRGRRVYLPRA